MQEIEYIKGDTSHIINERNRDIDKLQSQIQKYESMELDVTEWKSKWNLERNNYEAEIRQLKEIITNQKNEIEKSYEFNEKRKKDFEKQTEEK
jgi:hypothetical protein